MTLLKIIFVFIYLKILELGKGIVLSMKYIWKELVCFLAYFTVIGGGILGVWYGLHRSLAMSFLLGILAGVAGVAVINYIKSLYSGDREGAIYRALKKLAAGDYTKTFTLGEIAAEARIRDNDEVLCQINKLRAEGIVWISWLHEGKRYGLSGR